MCMGLTYGDAFSDFSFLSRKISALKLKTSWWSYSSRDDKRRHYADFFSALWAAWVVR